MMQMFFARSMIEIIKDIWSNVYTTYRAITEELNKRQIPNYSNKGNCHLRNTYKLIKRSACFAVCLNVSLKNMENRISKIINDFTKDTRKMLGDNLVEEYLFGSYARNEQTELSDIDILIIMKKFDAKIS